MLYTQRAIALVKQNLGTRLREFLPVHAVLVGAAPPAHARIQRCVGSFAVRTDNPKISVAYTNKRPVARVGQSGCLHKGSRSDPHVSRTRILAEGDTPWWETPCWWERERSPWTWHSAPALLIFPAE